MHIKTQYQRFVVAATLVLAFTFAFSLFGAKALPDDNFEPDASLDSDRVDAGYAEGSRPEGAPSAGIDGDYTVGIEKPTLNAEGNRDPEFDSAVGSETGTETDAEISGSSEETGTSTETDKNTETDKSTETEAETKPTEPEEEKKAYGFDPDSIKYDKKGKMILFDVDLTRSQQEYAVKMAKKFDIPVELIFGVMYVESRYDEDAMSSNGKYIGIMQIAKSNLKTLNKKFGITDLTDYKQNVKSGAYFISYYYSKYKGNVNKALMAYHCGISNAKRLWKEGVTEDGYCRKVVKEASRVMLAYNS